MRRFYGAWIDQRSMSAIWKATGKNTRTLREWREAGELILSGLDKVHRKTTKVLALLAKTEGKIFRRKRLGDRVVILRGGYFILQMTVVDFRSATVNSVCPHHYAEATLRNHGSDY